ncbi:MAG: MFS transporter [Cenarchaeum sp. SB0665_bin_23]|nr:MFS transporter [Cenarchaeum sp. SB0665_bin_23]MYC80025.1 MFS transporter [Cenarchaeum sp. SB0661_bin_35]MYG32729.1 MFS transporter [Cenarchaeum sp. SB0677_bin_16]
MPLYNYAGSFGSCLATDSIVAMHNCSMRDTSVNPPITSSLYILEEYILNMSRLALVIFIIIATLGVSIGIQAQAFPLLAKTEVGATYQDLGNLGIAKFLPYVVIPIFIGILLDRINNVYVLMLGTLLRIVPLFMISMATSVFEMIIWQLVIGSSHSFLWPASESLLSSNIRHRKRYIAHLILIFVGGMMVGPLLGAMILEASDNNLRLLFQISGGIMSVSLILTFWMRHARPAKRHTHLDLKSFTKIFRFPVVLSLLVLSTALFGMLFTTHPAFLNDNGIGISAILVLYAIYGVSRMLSMLLVPRIHDHAPVALTMSAVMITAAMVIFIVDISYSSVIIAMILLGVGLSIIYPMSLEAILSRTHRRIHNKIIGSFASLVGVGWVLGPLIGGYAANTFGSIAPYWLFLIIGAGVSCLSLLLHRRQNVNEVLSAPGDES